MGRRSTNEIIVSSSLRSAETAAAEVAAVGFTYVTVTADYDLANGLDPVGTVTFTLSEPMVNDDTVVAAPVSRALNIDGVLLIDLAANTDPATLPADTFYTVHEDISGATRSYTVVVPHDAGSTVELTTLGP